MKCGRNIEAATAILGWRHQRTVEFYYCHWKYSPEYQVWKAKRNAASSKARGVSVEKSSHEHALANLHASDPTRFRGPRMRATTSINYKV